MQGNLHPFTFHAAAAVAGDTCQLHRNIGFYFANTDIFFHTPNKTLIYVVHIPDNEKLQTRKEYREYYKRISPEMELSQHEYEDFANAVILNNYERFMDKVYHTIMAL